MEVFLANDLFVVMIYFFVKFFIGSLRDTITCFKNIRKKSDSLTLKDYLTIFFFGFSTVFFLLLAAVVLGGYFVLLNEYEVIPKTTIMFPIYQ